VDSAAPVTPTPTTLPRYTTEELVALLENRRELAALIDECTRVLGKVLSTHETSILLGIVDYLNVDSEYLLLLLAHCAKMGKKSVRYAEKLALSLYDEGVTTPDALQECLKQKEELQEIESKLRTLFGLSARALTTKERKMINTWLFTFHYGLDVITMAYEITVDAIGKSSLPYANSILERWNAAGLRTKEDIKQAEEERATAPKNPTSPGNSFDTDDFFAAALKRSFGDDFELSKK
jgi:DnaD/phage-associated family protein